MLRVRLQRGPIIAGGLVAVLHGIVLYGVFTARWFTQGRGGAVVTIDYIQLPPRLVPEQRNEHVDVVRNIPALLPPLSDYAIALGPLAPAQGALTPPIAPGQPDASQLVGIGRSLACNYADFDAVKDKADCALRLAQHPPAQVFALTSDELLLQTHFEVALAARHSPILLPCMSQGISLGALLCLVDGIENGFQLGADGIPTYADLDGKAGYTQSGRLAF